MILIAESGSTKTDWVHATADGQELGRYTSMGFNPYFHSSEFIAQKLSENEGLMAIAPEVHYVYFFGAGCSSDALNAQAKAGLDRIFTKARTIVDHDLVSAAYATYDGEPCVCCILGTGSNSCYFDGKEVYEEVPALGYILGDEGSGSYFGKRLLRAYFYKRLPQDVVRDLEDNYGISKEKILEEVYRSNAANVFLASLMPIVVKYKNLPLFQTMLVNGLKDYLDVHVCCFPQYKTVKANFVGSVAKHLEAELRIAGQEMGVNIGNIISKPVDRLVKYVLAHHQP